MKECFICGTCFPCEHRETELLPTEKLRAGRIANVIEREQYDLTGLLKELTPAQEIHKEFTPLKQILKEIHRSPRKTPVDACGKPEERKIKPQYSTGNPQVRPQQYTTAKPKKHST